MRKFIAAAIVVAASVLLASCSKNYEKDAQAYVDSYTKEYQKLSYDENLADWASNTHIVEGDTTNSHNLAVAKEAYAAFTGSTENIDTARKFLAHKDKLSPLLVRQLELILYQAGDNPQTVADIVKKRIKAENAQVEKLYGFDYKLDGKSVSANDIDDILRDSNDLAKRRAAWEESKEVGKTLKDGLVQLQKLRNETVQALGYKDYFDYQVSDYGMTTDQMEADLKQYLVDVWPLYREIHTWARYELAKRYGVKDVPDMIPADWLPNRWGQDWSPMVTVKGLDLDSKLKEKPADWIPHQAERFYESIGFPALPQSFWEKSDLYPAPAGANYKKNNHASAWHMDLDHDVRSLMSIEPNADWYETAHHEFGHIYYYLSYSTPEVPILLRRGANRGFHEAIGSLMGLAAMQRPFIEGIGLFPEGAPADTLQSMLKEALNFVVFMPWSAGVMTEFERDLYADNLPPDQYNAKWWELKEKYQGIVPPEPRGEDYCDAATKTHINDDPAQYYDYAISYVLLLQMHEHIARDILHQDPHATNYYGSKAVGDFLRTILSAGGTKDWRQLTRDATGTDLSAKPMLRYFEPVMEYLKKENAGRKYTLPENPTF